MPNNSIADKITAEKLHEERSKVLTPVDGDLGRLTFEVSPDRDGNGADVILWEKRGEHLWGIPVCHLGDGKEAEKVVGSLNDLAERGVLYPGPLLPTTDSVTNAPLFGLGEQGRFSSGVSLKLVGENAWGSDIHFFENREEAIHVGRSLSRLLEARVVRATKKFVIPFEELSPKRLVHWEDLDASMVRMAKGNGEALAALKGACEALPMVDPENKKPAMALLESLDQAQIYGNDIAGLSRICGRHPGKMLAVLRATSLGLIDIPAIKDALVPVGIIHKGGLDVDGVTQEVERLVRGFSASRVTPTSIRTKEVLDIPDTSKIPKVSGHQPDQGKKQGADGR